MSNKIENYAGFVTALKGADLLSLLRKEEESCFRLSNTYLNKGKALRKHINEIYLATRKFGKYNTQTLRWISRCKCESIAEYDDFDETCDFCGVEIPKNEPYYCCVMKLHENGIGGPTQTYEQENISVSCNGKECRSKIASNVKRFFSQKFFNEGRYHNILDGLKIYPEIGVNPDFSVSLDMPISKEMIKCDCDQVRPFFISVSFNYEIFERGAITTIDSIGLFDTCSQARKCSDAYKKRISQIATRSFTDLYPMLQEMYQQ